MKCVIIGVNCVAVSLCLQYYLSRLSFKLFFFLLTDRNFPNFLAQLQAAKKKERKKGVEI